MPDIITSIVRLNESNNLPSRNLPMRYKYLCTPISNKQPTLKGFMEACGDYNPVCIVYRNHEK